MNTDENNRIFEFEEKPKNPKSNLASMGVYIFNWKTLKEYFLRGKTTKECLDDFGKDVIPAMLQDNQDMFAYSFKGYWRDVGTIESLWEANMDLIKTPEAVDLNDSNWRIYTNTMDMPPQYVGANADIKRAYITQGCVIDGEVKNSVLFTSSKVGTNAKVFDSVLMPNAVVEDGAVLNRVLVADGVRIGKGAVVGSADSEHIELIANDVEGGN